MTGCPGRAACVCLLFSSLIPLPLMARDFLPPAPEPTALIQTTRSLAGDRIRLTSQWQGWVDEGPGVRLQVTAPGTFADQEALTIPVAVEGSATLATIVARPADGTGTSAWVAGVNLPPISPAPSPFTVLRSQFLPAPDSGTQGPLPARELDLEIRLTNQARSPIEMEVGPTTPAWISQGVWPATGTETQYTVTVQGDPANLQLSPGQLHRVPLRVATPSGLGLNGKFAIEGPDRDNLDHPDFVDVVDGRTHVEVWARRPGIYRLHFLEPLRRTIAPLELTVAVPPDKYAMEIFPDGFLGRAWISAHGPTRLNLVTTAPLGQAPLQSIHVRVREASGNPVFSRWYDARAFVRNEAQFATPAMGWLTVECNGTTLPLDQVSQLDADYPMSPDLIPTEGTPEAKNPPFSLTMTEWPDGVTTSGYAGLVITLEELATTVPVAARDRFAMIANHRSPSENQLYPFPLGIDGAGQLQDRPLDQARSLAAVHRRLGTFWAAEELDFAQANPAPGMRLWIGPDRIWPLRKAEFTKVVMVLRGLARWQGKWPVESVEGLSEWKNWLRDLKLRYPQVSMWIIGRDANRPGLEPDGTLRPPWTPAAAAQLVRASSEALSESSRPFRLGIGGTDGFPHRFLDDLLQQLDPATTGLQALTIRLQPKIPGLLPARNEFPAIAQSMRQLLRQRNLQSRECWWLPVGFATHPAGLDSWGQSAALSQTMAIAISNRIAKVFWSRIADRPGFHPEDLESRSGLLDHRLRPKPVLANFLVNSYMLTSLQPMEELREPSFLRESPQTTGPISVTAHHFGILPHSLKRAGRLTIAWTEGTQPGGSAPQSARSEESAPGFPPIHWPLPPHPGGKTLYGYQSTLGGAVFAFSAEGALMRPLSMEKTGETPLGPTGRYLFPVGSSPLYIWDSGLNWGVGEARPQ